jgi:polyisoprenoid-binding protein YceI
VLQRAWIAVVWLAASASQLVGTSPASDRLEVFRESRVVIEVGRSGLLGLAGHAHEVEAPVGGSIVLDRSDPAHSEVVLEFETAALRVTGRGEPARDVPEVQRVMLSDRVLDATRYPTITFRSRSIAGVTASEHGLLALVTGDLTLHGVTRPLAIPVRVTFTDDSLSAEGTATVKQTDFGMQPVTAAGGAIRVKDELEISFNVKAGRPAAGTGRKAGGTD